MLRPKKGFFGGDGLQGPTVLTHTSHAGRTHPSKSSHSIKTEKRHLPMIHEPVVDPRQPRKRAQSKPSRLHARITTSDEGDVTALFINENPTDGTDITMNTRYVMFTTDRAFIGGFFVHHDYNALELYHVSVEVNIPSDLARIHVFLEALRVFDMEHWIEYDPDSPILAFEVQHRRDLHERALQVRTLYYSLVGMHLEDQTAPLTIPEPEPLTRLNTRNVVINNVRACFVRGNVSALFVNPAGSIASNESASGIACIDSSGLYLAGDVSDFIGVFPQLYNVSKQVKYPLHYVAVERFCSSVLSFEFGANALSVQSPYWAMASEETVDTHERSRQAARRIMDSLHDQVELVEQGYLIPVLSPLSYQLNLTRFTVRVVREHAKVTAFFIDSHDAIGVTRSTHYIYIDPSGLFIAGDELYMSDDINELYERSEPVRASDSPDPLEEFFDYVLTFDLQSWGRSSNYDPRSLLDLMSRHRVHRASAVSIKQMFDNVMASRTSQTINNNPPVGGTNRQQPKPNPKRKLTQKPKQKPKQKLTQKPKPKRKQNQLVDGIVLAQ